MSKFLCALQCGELCDSESKDSLFNISSDRWETVKNKSKLWQGLDKFGNVYNSVDWDKGPSGMCMHDKCRLSLMSDRVLKQAVKRHEKMKISNSSDSQMPSTSQSDPLVEEPAPKRLRSSLGVIHDKNLCVWCRKGESSKNKETKLLLLSYDHAWAAFKSHTVILDEQDMRDRINCLIDNAADDPFAIEIRYHLKCWLKYVRKYQKMTEDDKIPLMQNVTLREAQTIFFDHTRSVIFQEHELRSLQSLLHDYRSIVSRYGFTTDGVKSSYIKEILIREFQDSIGFHPRPQRNQSDLVYDTAAGGSYIEAALTSMGVSNEQLVRNLSKRIVEDVKSTGSIVWPPRVEELEEAEELSPLLLHLISALRGKPGVDLSPKALSLTSFLTQHILGKPTRTAINATVTLHGITRSKELVDSNYKLGIGISYQNVLYLRDAWAMNDLQWDDHCPAEIANGKPGISIIDNDDFKNDTLTGGGTSHRSNWMFLQREEYVNQVPQDNEEERPRNPKVVSEALNRKVSEMQKVKPYKTIKRGEPPVRDKPDNYTATTEPQRKRSIIHALVRADNGDRPEVSDQKIPSYNGFQATLSSEQGKSKAYYHMSYDQPPNKSVVKDIMDKLAVIITEKNMPFAYLVGDLPVYILITELKAENSERYSAIIPFLGPFHTQCVMMTAIFKRYEGSELEEVLVQAGVVAAGSVKQALKGKHFRRGLRCLRLVYEALTSKLIKEHTQNLSEETKRNLEIVRDIKQSKQARSAAYEALEEDEEIERLVSNIFSHVNGSDMADYWKDFFLMTDALMQSVHAVHSINLDEYISSVRAILPWIVAYDKINYGRWLPDFWAMLTTLPANQLEFLRANFAQSLSGNPYSNLCWDMWIECTMNKGSKMKSGWLSILKNEKQLLVHSRNVNNIARIRAAHNATANRKKSKWKHTECNPKRMKEDEQCVQNLVACLTEFEAYPFDPDFPVLRTMQSGVPAPQKLIEDFKSAHADGEERISTFLDERIYSKSKSIHARMRQMNRKTFVNTSDELHDGQDLKAKAAAMEQTALKAVINLVERSDVIDLNNLLEHRVVEECISIFNSNGTYRKITKSQLTQCLEFDAVKVQEPYTALVDMGMVWRMAVPSAEDQSTDNDSKLTWSDYAKNVCSTILSRHPNAERIICVNDVYDTQYSIKDDERELRVQGMGHIPNEHFKLDDPFPSTGKFNKILCSKSNKVRLQKFLQRYITEKAPNINTEILYSIGKQCTNLSTDEQKEDFSCDQLEADTVIFSIYAVLRNSGYRGPVVLDAADTDIYVAASYTSHVYPGDLLMKRKDELVDCRKFVNDSMVDCIIPMHCMTGCDANSGFFGKGKKKTYEKIEKSQSAQRQIMKCGESLNIDEDVIQALMQFTRHIMYGDAKSKSMAEARATKWKSLKNKNFSRLPPDEDSLRQHCKRANYLAYLIRHPSIKDHPSPIGNGWEIINGHCRPVRNTKPSLPVYLTPFTESEDTGQQNMDTSDESLTEHDDTDDDTDYGDDMEYDDIDSDSGSDDDYSDLESD